MKKLSMLALVLAATSAQGAEVSRYVTRGASADASFTTEGECGNTNAYVGAYEDLRRSGPETTSWQGSWAGVEHYDWCTNEVSTLWVEVYGASFSANQTRSASLAFSGYGLQTVLVGCEEVTDENHPHPIDNCVWDYVQVPVEIDLQWTADGQYSGRGVSMYSWSGPGVRTTSRYNGSGASAAVTGSFVIDGVDVAANSTSVWANINQNNNGEVTISKY